MGGGEVLANRGFCLFEEEAFIRCNLMVMDLLVAVMGDGCCWIGNLGIDQVESSKA